MKTNLRTSTCGSMMVIILLSAAVTTCDRQEDDPFYVGTWQYKEKVYAGEFAYNTTRTLILTETTFEEIYVMQRDNSTTIASVLGMKGDLDVSGAGMTFSLQAVGDCVKDAQNKCTSSVQWYVKGSSGYNNYIQYLEETVSGEFEADEDYLWLVRDSNNDGDTDDDWEDMEFERL